MRRQEIKLCLLAAVLAALAALPLPPRAAGAGGEQCSISFGEQCSISLVEHEYAPLREVKLEFKDFSFPTPEGATLNLREQARGKRLVLITFFAAWCENSQYDVATVNELYAKYREQGLEVVGVSEYSSAAELRQFVAQYKPAYPICVESDDRLKDQKATLHYRYRKKVGDKRQWGTPFSVLIGAEDVEEQGGTFAKRVRVAPGELIKAEVEEFIRRQLSAPSEEK